MIKKALFAGGALALLIALVFGRNAIGYISTGIGIARDSVRDSVPVEVDIRMARDQIRSLGPVIRKNMERIALEEAQIIRLEIKVNRAEEGLAQMKSDILRLTDDLDGSSSEYFVYVKDGKDLNYTREDVKRDLKLRFAAYQSKEQEKSHWGQILDARADTLAAAREKLSAMRAAKDTLEVEVERLESKLEMVNVAKAKSEFKFDDSKLSRVRKLMEEIDIRIEVQAKMADAGEQYPSRIPLEQTITTSGNITQQVHDYFGQDAGALAKQ